MPTLNITLNVVFRKYDDGSVVAECLEIPGCVSEGDTEKEAKANIANAIDMCLSVILEDAIAAKRPTSLNLVGIEKQEVLEIEAPHILQQTVGR